MCRHGVLPPTLRRQGLEGGLTILALSAFTVAAAFYAEGDSLVAF